MTFASKSIIEGMHLPTRFLEEGRGELEVSQDLKEKYWLD